MGIFNTQTRSKRCPTCGAPMSGASNSDNSKPRPQRQPASNKKAEMREMPAPDVAGEAAAPPQLAETEPGMARSEATPAEQINAERAQRGQRPYRDTRGINRLINLMENKA